MECCNGRETDRQRETERETERDRERQRETETETEGVLIGEKKVYQQVHIDR